MRTLEGENVGRGGTSRTAPAAVKTRMGFVQNEKERKKGKDKKPLMEEKSPWRN